MANEEHPRTFNDNGTCYICGVALGFYESKYIECDAPHRFRCIRRATICSVGINERLWWYYTDG